MSIMKKENCKLSGAPTTMHKQGQITDSIVLKEIMKKPGVTVSEIAETLRWSNGKTDGSINRLLLNKKIIIKHYLQRGMLLKRVYPENYLSRPKNIVELPTKIIDQKLWNKSAFVYALSRSTIGFAPEEIEEWNEKALFKDHVDFQKNKDNIQVMIPNNLEMFYQLENSDMSISTIGNLALVTVESVLPVSLPPAYPEQRPIARLEFTVTRERIEGTSLNARFVYLKEGITKQLTIFSEPNYTAVKKESIKTFAASTVNPCNEIINMIAEV
jgi:hypothetical protein